MRACVRVQRRGLPLDHQATLCSTTLWFDEMPSVRSTSHSRLRVSAKPTHPHACLPRGTAVAWCCCECDVVGIAVELLLLVGDGVGRFTCTLWLITAVCGNPNHLSSRLAVAVCGDMSHLSSWLAATVCPPFVLAGRDRVW
jgi:hypothetical protein